MKRKASEIGVADRVNDLGTTALAVASKLFYEAMFGNMDNEPLYN